MRHHQVSNHQNEHFGFLIAERFCRRRRLIAVKILVRENLVTKLRTVAPADDRLTDFPLQELLNILPVGDVLIILDVVAVGPGDFLNDEGFHELLECFGIGSNSPLALWVRVAQSTG